MGGGGGGEGEGIIRLYLFLLVQVLCSHFSLYLFTPSNFTVTFFILQFLCLLAQVIKYTDREHARYMFSATKELVTKGMYFYLMKINDRCYVY